MQQNVSTSGKPGQFVRLNPVTGEIASTAQAATAVEANAAADKAAAAFPAWSESGPNARRQLLLKASQALASKKDEFVALMQVETGATASWAAFNVMLAASMIAEAASLTTQIKGEVIPSDKPGCHAMSVREAVGVCLGIAPWNAPIILGVRAIATALACGNTVVLKASEKCPAVHSLIIECFQSAGFPEGVVNVVTNAPEDAAEVVNTLIDHPAVRRINFTGSTGVGKMIARRAAEHLKPVLLELGGKAPFVVLDDANLDEAVAAAAFGAGRDQRPARQFGGDIGQLGVGVLLHRFGDEPVVGQQVGHLRGEDFAEQGFQFAVRAFGLLLLQPAWHVVVGHQIDFDGVTGLPE